ADVHTDFALPPVELAPASLGHLVLVPTPAHKTRGDFDLVAGKAAVSDAPAYTFSGMALYRPALFEGTAPGRFPLAPLLFDAAGRGLLEASLYEGPWVDVGTPERLAALQWHQSARGHDRWLKPRAPPRGLPRPRPGGVFRSRA